MATLGGKTMKIKSIAPWFGGKRTLAPLVVEQLGDHGQYFEPFCGSMAVLMVKEPCQKETVNDLHGDLINLARVVSDPDIAPKLYERLTRAVLSEQLVKESRTRLEEPMPEGPDIVRAYWYFLSSWMGRNGTSGCERQDYQIAVRWTQDGGSPVIRWRNAVDSLPAWHVRLQNVVILNRDAFKIIDRLEDHERTAIYVDPPYLPETRTGYDKNTGRYLHEFKSSSGLFGEQDDHAKLAEVMRSYKRARVVVSYYDCPRARNLYDGWTFIECTMRKNINQQSARTKYSGTPKDAPEVLIVNGEEY